MKKKTILIVAILLLAAIIGICAVYANTPERQAAQFVKNHGADFSALVAQGQPLPAAYEGICIDVWSGEQILYEFLLGTGAGDRQYWGVYYSPDDVPAPFQNADVALFQTEEACWTWEAEGDNHGMTRKITDQWYYFEASF